jgi:hypothetical protein
MCACLSYRLEDSFGVHGWLVCRRPFWVAVRSGWAAVLAAGRRR